jgi:CBS domain-containing protein
MRSRWLYARTTVTGDPTEVAAILLERAPQVLRRALVAGDADGAVLPLRVTVEDEHGSRTCALMVQPDPVREEQGTVAVPLRWTSDPAGAPMPPFLGALELDRAGDRTVEVAVFGQLQATSALPTPVVDAAHHALRRLARGVAAELSRLVLATQPSSDMPVAPRLRVSDVMSPDPLVLTADLPLRTAAMLLLRHGHGGAPVLDDSGTLVGVLTASDLLAREASPRDRGGVAARQELLRRRARTAGEACSRPALTVTPGLALRDAARELLDLDVSRLVVVEEGTVVGILSRRDVLKSLTRTAATLQEAVDAQLEVMGVPGVHADVAADGHVTLSGRTQLRSTVERLVTSVGAVDGIGDVTSELDWSEDDVTVSA